MQNSLLNFLDLRNTDKAIFTHYNEVLYLLESLNQIVLPSVGL